MGNRLKGRKPAKKIPPSQVRYLKRLSIGPKAYAVGNSSLTALEIEAIAYSAQSTARSSAVSTCGNPSLPETSMTSPEITDAASAIAADVMGNDHLLHKLDEQQADEVHGHVQEAVIRHLSAALAAGAPGVTIAALQRAHVERQEEWCPDQKPDLSFRGNEMAGEVGEACNVIKKLERERHGWRGSRASKDDLAQELADVVHTAVLCAITAGIDLAPAVVAKFNATSEKNGLASRLSALEPAPSALVAEPGEPVAWPEVADKLFWSAKEFIDDWKKGDFSLSTLAAIDAQSLDDHLVSYSEARRAALAQSAAPVAPEDPYWKGAYERMADRNVVLSEAVKSAILVLDDLATGQGIDIPIEQIIRDLNAVAHTGGAPASPDDPYDRGRRDILNALLAPNPAIAAKIAKWAEPPHDPDPEGRLPFDVALWITEVAEQLGIKSLEELGEASPVQQAAPSGEGE